MVTVDQIQKALDGIRPHLQADGGDVEFVSMSDDGVVSVRLKGACGSCPMALMTLKKLSPFDVHASTDLIYSSFWGIVPIQ